MTVNTKATLYNLKISLFTDIVNEFNIQTEDLPLFEQVLWSIRNGVYVDRVPYSEDLPIVSTDEVGDTIKDQTGGKW